MLHSILRARTPWRFALFVVLVLLTGVIALVRARGDLPLTPDTVRDAIRSWGALAPLIFIAAFALRPLVFFPSTLLFLAGGLAFGAAWGTIYAAVGGTLGAVLGFGVARMLGREFVHERLGDLLPERTGWGAGLVFLLNLVPVFPLTAINYGAGLSGMNAVPFTFAAALGLAPRAFAYSFFGSSLVDVRSNEFVLAVVLLVGLLVLPLAIRRYLLRRGTGETVAPTT